LLACNVLM